MRITSELSNAHLGKLDKLDGYRYNKKVTVQSKDASGVGCREDLLPGSTVDRCYFFIDTTIYVWYCNLRSSRKLVSDVPDWGKHQSLTLLLFI